MKTAIIYSRVSTKEQANEKQVEQLIEYCQTNGYEIRGKFEEKVSGAATEKEELDKITNEEPMADILVIREISRLSREEDVSEAQYKVSRLAKKYEIHVVADNYIIPRGIMQINDLFLLVAKLFGAADERKKIAMRTTEARKRYAVDFTNYAAGGVPFGLKKVTNDNHKKGINTKCKLEINEDEWQTVLNVYNLTAAGLSHAQVARNVGISPSLVYNILRNKKIKMFLDDKTLIDAAKEASTKNNSAPSPSKHVNMYKGIIFDGDTERPMVHQCATKGNRYLVAGKGAISDEDLNETVLKALQSFVTFFNVKKEDVVKEHNAQIKQIGIAIEANVSLLHAKQAEKELTIKKAEKATDLNMFERMNKQAEKLEKEINELSKQISQFHKQIKQLKNVEIKNEDVTLENLETYVQRFVKAVRYYPVKPFVRRIRVEIKDEYLPEGANNFREYEVCNSRWERYILPLEIKYGNEMVKELGITVEDNNDYWNVNPSIYYSND